jgi:hypothetical protein
LSSRVINSENRRTGLFPSHLASARTTGASETKQHRRPGRADRQHHRVRFRLYPRRTHRRWVLLPAAFVLSIVGLCLSGKSKGTSIAAVIISITGVVVGVVVFFAVVADAFDDAFGKSDFGKSDCQYPRRHRPKGATMAIRPAAEGIRFLSASRYITKNGRSHSASRIRLGRLSRLKTSSTMRLRRAWSTGSSPSQPPTPETPPPMRASILQSSSSDPTTGRTTIAAESSPTPLSDVGALYKGGSAQGNVCVAVPAGAEGLWTVSTSFGDPVFFRR